MQTTLIILLSLNLIAWIWNVVGKERLIRQNEKAKAKWEAESEQWKKDVMGRFDRLERRDIIGDPILELKGTIEGSRNKK